MNLLSLFPAGLPLFGGYWCNKVSILDASSKVLKLKAELGKAFEDFDGMVLTEDGDLIPSVLARHKEGDLVPRSRTLAWDVVSFPRGNTSS